jgi:hypothetical protein
MAYACPDWEFATDTLLMKLQRLQNNVLRTTDNRNTPWYAYGFSISAVYDYIIKLCMPQSQVIRSHENVNVCNSVQDKARHIR